MCHTLRDQYIICRDDDRSEVDLLLKCDIRWDNKDEDNLEDATIEIGGERMEVGLIVTAYFEGVVGVLMFG
ncbi:hypothetical protein TNCT_417121 [Trichonephila clavata]|uniref:Uncharacterized protein n=1 Tax=Trichonephila clavata TaxID=2740835 RepID=A0A8X6GCY5_TRICU|nr:hypothetical protein TNCT_417121 [Trichonephila clavata]